MLSAALTICAERLGQSAFPHLADAANITMPMKRLRLHRIDWRSGLAIFARRWQGRGGDRPCNRCAYLQSLGYRPQRILIHARVVSSHTMQAGERERVFNQARRTAIAAASLSRRHVGKRIAGSCLRRRRAISPPCRHADRVGAASRAHCIRSALPNMLLLIRDGRLY